MAKHSGHWLPKGDHRESGGHKSGGSSGCVVILVVAVLGWVAALESLVRQLV